jgi:hypothetical protein
MKRDKYLHAPSISMLESAADGLNIRIVARQFSSNIHAEPPSEKIRVLRRSTYRICQHRNTIRSAPLQGAKVNAKGGDTPVSFHFHRKGVERLLAI